MSTTLIAFRLARVTMLTVLLGGLVGCGAPTYPVAGRVVFEQGKAATELAGGTVGFESVDLDPVVSASATIQGDGSFQLGTNDRTKGLPAGRYRVFMLPPRATEIEGPKPPSGIEARFLEFETSQLEYVVGPDSSEFLIKVKRTPPPP